MVSAHGEGYLLAGRYRLSTVIGSGGMGTVWSAHDDLLHRAVAVKELRLTAQLTYQQRVELTQQAISEARSAARLHHPRIVSVYDVVTDADRPWIIMQLVDGKPLHEAIAHDGPWSPQRVAQLAGWLLDALEAAHAAGVVHRDVKPSNVIIPAGGGAMLTDFSIAKVLGTGTMTSTGMLMGSPGYIAPERIMTGTAGPEVDLFGLGATLYFAVEGKGPFDNADAVASAFASAVHQHPRPQRAGELAELIDKLLEKQPAQRATITQAKALLAAIGSPEPRPGPPQPTARQPAGPTGSIIAKAQPTALTQAVPATPAVPAVPETRPEAPHPVAPPGEPPARGAAQVTSLAQPNPAYSVGRSAVPGGEHPGLEEATMPAPVVQPTRPDRTGMPTLDPVGVQEATSKRKNRLMVALAAGAVLAMALTAGALALRGKEDAGTPVADAIPVAAPSPSSTAEQAVADLRPPGAPAKLYKVGSSQISVVLGWLPATDNVGVTQYLVFRDDKQVGTAQEPLYTDNGLTGKTAYQYYVKARDAAGNVSPASAKVKVTTLSVPDTVVPVKVTGLAQKAATTTSITITWARSKDNTGVTMYRVWRNGTQVGQVPATVALEYKDSGLTADTTYSYVVTAVDAAGNLSPASDALSVKTTAVPYKLPTAPTLTATAGPCGAVQLSWTASSVDSRLKASYQLVRGGTVIASQTATAYTNSGLSNYTVYSFKVNAVDSAGQVTASNTVNIRTKDCVKPPTPTIKVGAVGRSSISMSWNAVTDSGAGLAYYQVLRNNVVVGNNLTGTSYNSTGLAANTSYTFAVRAVDKAGNISGTTTFTAKTLPHQFVVDFWSVDDIVYIYVNGTLKYSWDIKGDTSRSNPAPVDITKWLGDGETVVVFKLYNVSGGASAAMNFTVDGTSFARRSHSDANAAQNTMVAGYWSYKVNKTNGGHVLVK